METARLLAAADGPLKINWAEMPTYNTIMAVAAGAGLLLVVGLGRRLAGRGTVLHPEGWALAFGVLGLILTLTGLHMTLTWPLAAGGFPFDNIIFGEPSLAFGVLMLAAALFLWRRGTILEEHPDRPGYVAGIAGPMSIFIVGMGLACFGIAAAGIWYELFAAPEQEPISGLLADHPMIEATFISVLYALVGVGAVLFPAALGAPRGPLGRVVGFCWALAGLLFLIFGALNYFTHIGLIVNTM
ncbi:DUF981 family protein [Actinomadura xylanilytica]|uniref:DUF981 family protein n=1 Tax=Actinomadura xylanilytica TaxID=887459 RepID=UPI00255AB5BA|nr:DUF981 family protein [Actinomadura xylanilytica]MDL4771222.1 DUF981 family protein [Actinomadura xylanilytica]